MLKKYFLKIKNHFKEVLRIKTSPHAIGVGFAIGTFIAIFPTFGFHIVIGLLVVAIFKKINKIALFGSFLIWNPLVLLSLHPLEQHIGDLMLGEVPITMFSVELWNEVYNYTLRYLLGSTILAVVVSVASYFLIRFAVSKYYLLKK